jgi:hypothetical protein
MTGLRRLRREPSERTGGRIPTHGSDSRVAVRYCAWSSAHSSLRIGQSFSRPHRVRELSFSSMQAHCRLVATSLRIRTYIRLDDVVVRPNACLRIHTPVLVIARGRHTRIVHSRGKLSFPGQSWTKVGVPAIESLSPREDRTLLHDLGTRAGCGGGTSNPEA